MTNRQVVELWNSLTAPSMLNHRGVKFSYSVTKTKQSIKGTITALEMLQNQKPESMDAFEKERLELCMEYADLDDDGNQVMQGKNYKITERLSEFEVAFTELQEKHDQAFKDLQKHLQGFEKLLDEEIDVDVHMMSIGDIPETITVKEMNGIEFLISDGPT